MLTFAPTCAQEHSGDLGDGTFANPVMWLDTPDPDVIRVGDDYYMVNTTMFYPPGPPVMPSNDLVHWPPVPYIHDPPAATPPSPESTPPMGLLSNTTPPIGSAYASIHDMQNPAIKQGHFSESLEKAADRRFFFLRPV